MALTLLRAARRERISVQTYSGLPSGVSMHSATQALAASGAPVRTAQDAETLAKMGRPWQRRAFLYNNLVPEIRYASGFYSRHLSKVELLVQQRNGDGDWEVVDDASDPTVGFLDRIQDEQGGRSTLLGTYGRLRFLVGECYLICFDAGTEDEHWEALSLHELKPMRNGKGFERIRYEGGTPEIIPEATDDQDWQPIPDSAYVWRLWKRHPEFSMQADSNMQACQDVCEELLLLTLAVRARLRSRIANSGILKLPNEISPPPQTPVNASAPLEDVFMRNLARHMEAPLVDEGSAAQIVPLLVRGPAQFLKDLDQLTFKIEGGADDIPLRAECISRLANGLDMPREALLGTADVNHWGAWQIDQQTWDAHVQPVVEEMCDEFSAVLLRPSMEATGYTRASAREYRIWYDPVKITNHPDRGKDAQDLFTLGALSEQAFRTAKGFDENDEPSLAERARYIGVRVHDGGLAWYGKPTLKAGATAEKGQALPPTEDDDDGADGGGDSGTTETAPPDGGTGNDATTGAPPAPEDESPAAAHARETALLMGGVNPGNVQAARLLGAAETALLQCRNLAGARLRGKVVPRAERSVYETWPNHKLYALIPHADLARYLAAANGNGSPKALVRGGTESFEETLRAMGYTPERVSALSDLVREHAAATLRQAEPDALPPTLFAL